ncbi:MAG TPA: amidohydrolase family protein [Candidatus Binatia bacterium]
MVIDGDGHCNEPRDLFERYLEKEFRDRGPKVVDVSGFRWMVEGKLLPRPVGVWGHGSASGFFGTGMKAKGMAAASQSLDDYEGRLKDLDKEGIDIQVAYPNIMALASLLDDGELAAAMCRAYNNYCAEKCKPYNGRVRAIAAVALQNPAEAAKELQRALGMGLVGTVVTGTVGQKNLDDRCFDEFFRTANELGAAVGVHWITGCFDSPGQERFKDPYFYIHMVGMPFNLMIGIMTLIGGGIMEKYPRIKFVFLEIGAAWLPYWMWRMDDHYTTSSHALANLPKAPSDYVRSDSCFVSCEPDEEGLANTAEILGEDRIIFASDYPHGDCDFPNSVRKIRARKDISESLKESILWKNPARLYGIS